MDREGSWSTRGGRVESMQRLRDWKSCGDARLRIVGVGGHDIWMNRVVI